VVSKLLQEDTASKFKIFGSKQEDNMKKMAADEISADALPRYLGGTGLNPPGLALNLDVKKGKPDTLKYPIPAGHTLYWRFSSAKPVSVEATYEGKELVKCDTKKEWVEGEQKAMDADGVVEIKLSAAANTTLQYEVTATPPWWTTNEFTWGD
jgi:hypothetical protein